MQITSSIVLYHTSEEDLTKVISSFFDNDIDIDNFTLFLVDNSNTDYLGKFENLHPGIQYIFNNKNIGYGAAHNVAIKKAIELGSKYHFILNPDIYFERNTIKKIIDYMRINSDVGHVMPKVVYPDGALQYLCKLIPSPLDLLLRRFIPEKLYRKRKRKFQLEFTGYNKIMEIPYLSGCFMALQVDSLVKVGLFDERFFMYPEDIDLTRRITEKYKTIFYPEVTIVHNHAKESFKSKKMLFIHILNMIKYFNKWGWIFDRKRKKINQEVLKKLNYK